MMVAGVDPLGVDAGWTHSPAFQIGDTRVDAADLDLMRARVKAVLRSEFSQGHRSRALVLVGDGSCFGAALPALRFPPLQYDRTELHARLRERVVGYQSLVGQEVERVAAVDLAVHRSEPLPDILEFGDFAQGGLILRLALQFANPLPERPNVGGHRAPLLDHVAQSVEDLEDERRRLLVYVSEHEAA